MALVTLWAAVSQEDPLQATGVSSGLAVHLGTTDGALEAALTNNGRILVHGVALDDASLTAARAHLQAKGLSGLASVERASLDPLPYADNLVTLLVADTSLKGFSEKEAMRVLAPLGTAYLKKGGEWTKAIKPRPAAMDDWTHFDYGPEGNGVSRDRLIRPATHVQWSFGGQPIKLGGNPAGYKVFTGFRVAGGRAFFEWTSGEDKKDRETFYTGRDAFNGLPLWTVKETAGFGRKEWQFVAVKDRVYTFLEKGGPMVALDAASGDIVRTFEQGGRLTDEVNLTTIRVRGETIVQSAGDTLRALEAATGALRWKHTEEKSLLLFPTVSADRVFAVVAEDQKKGQFNRWPYIKATAIACFDLATGKPLWRCAEVAGSDIGQLVYSDGSLALFGAGAIGGSKEPYMGRIDTATGKLLWRATFKTNYNRFGYNLLVRDGTMYYADAWRIYALDMKTGEETRPFDDGGYNMRCNRFSATDDWLIYGYVALVDKAWGGTYQSITRGGCAQGCVPANGLMYFTPQACHCFTMLRGHLALSSEPLRDSLPDALRLEQGPARKGGVAPEGTAIVVESAKHRLEARDAAGKTLWSFTAGGRITGPPLIHEGLCLFGSHDGWVYALRTEDGALAWRFRASPYERKYVADQQLESSWPVYGVTLHEGLVCFSAGLHPEVGGGIYVYGLEPATGTMKWKKGLRKPPFPLAGKERKPPPVVPNRILNDALKSDGTSLSLPGIAFDPRTTDEELRKLIEDPLPKKR